MSQSNAQEKILQDIGNLLARNIGGDPGGAFLYAECEPGMITSAIFVDRGDHVDYFDCDNDLTNAVMDLWHAAEPAKRWGGISYTIAGRSFEAEFHYSQAWVEGEICFDRRERILAAKYGDKPIKYPPPPEGAVEFRG